MNLSIRKNLHCRACKGESLTLVHDFGLIPIADKLLAKNESANSIPQANLSISFCSNCTLLQINEDISPEQLFKDNYPYFSSKIPEVSAHFQTVANEILEEFKINEKDEVIEIAGNDGVFLRHFLPSTKRLLNIEPSTNPAKVSKNLNIETHQVFFNAETAKELTSYHPKIIFAANVFAHVPDPDSFVKGLHKLATNETTIIMEVPHLLAMIKHNIFDVIFHQHYSYFSLNALKLLFERNGLYINKVKKVQTQGGTLRLYINKFEENASDGVEEILQEEENTKLGEIQTYRDFANHIVKQKQKTIQLLKEFKAEGKRIVGYGAPGKAATLLNYYQINRDYLDYLVDLSESKQGFIFPHTSLEIYPIEKLLEDKPDVVLILAWNYKESILKHLKPKLPDSTKFISVL